MPYRVYDYALIFYFKCSILKLYLKMLPIFDRSQRSMEKQAIKSNVNQSLFCISQITIGFDSDMYGRFKLSLVDNWSPSVPNMAIKDTIVSSALNEIG